MKDEEIHNRAAWRGLLESTWLERVLSNRRDKSASGAGTNTVVPQFAANAEKNRSEETEGRKLNRRAGGLGFDRVRHGAICLSDRRTYKSLRQCLSHCALRKFAPV
jgi:hypothetical protein